jgi:phosphoglycolate phosphatase
VIGGSSGLPRKPDPAILIEAARRLGAEPAETLMVGDSLPDVAAARAAGMAVVVVDSGYGEIAAGDLGADSILETLAALPGHHSSATA